MNLRQLRYFAQVVESGSFSKAAARLHIAQPSLSQHVRHMEDELGVALLHRGAHGVTATEAGERLLAHAKSILAEFSEIPDSVRGEAAPRGEVRFGMPGTVSEQLAAPLIEAARIRYPEVRIRIVEAMSGYVLDWLKRGSVDLAMLYSMPDASGLAVHHGLSEEICLFANASLEEAAKLTGATVPLADVAGLALVIPGRGHGLRELVEDAAASIGSAIEPSIEIDSYSQIKKLVMRRLGFGILPRMAVAREAEEGAIRLWRVEQPPITRKVYLAYSTQRLLLYAPRAVGQLAWETLRGLVASGAWTAELSDESNRPALFS
jgi:LysR family nitrogen assimilation transcriptional regulator